MDKYDPRAVANYFIQKAADHRTQRNKGKKGEESSSDYYLSALQVNKMVFVAYGYYLAYFDKTLCNELPEMFDASTVKGVYFYKLYFALSSYGADKVRNLIFSNDPVKNYSEKPKGDNKYVVEFSSKAKAVLEAVWACQIETNMECPDWSYYTDYFVDPGIIEDFQIADIFKNILDLRIPA